VLLKRAQAGLDALRQSDRADNNRLAAIGYCMGGGVALNLARSGADLKAIVGFHCGLSNMVKQTGKIKAKILVCEGADDKTLSEQEQQAFKDEMRAAKLDWMYVVFGNALHAFTNPEADKHRDLGIGYNENADRRSWQLMRDFLAEALDHRPQNAAERGIANPR
jgi:dienelactone hydrolase